MAQTAFGGQHTERKLAILEKYLDAYTTALKKQPFETVYVDAFAGTGEIPVIGRGENLLGAEDLGEFIRGSAIRALSTKAPFSKYLFIERSASKLAELHRLQVEFPHLASRMEFVKDDANNAVDRFCTSTDWRRTRAVVFLDPFGNQVKWNTVETIGRSKAIDLWYLFPAGLGVHRQIGRGGSVHPTHAQSLDELLGSAEWRKSFIQSETINDLFGHVNRMEKTATPASITAFMIERMKGPFQGHVLDEWLPLGSRNIHMYSLIFACANPSPALGIWRSDLRPPY